MSNIQSSKGTVWTKRCCNLDDDVCSLFDRSGLANGIRQQKILIKPNLVEALQPPITTPVTLIEAIVLYLKEKVPEKELVIGEGTGSTDYDTFHCFDVLGYSDMVHRRNIELVDLNREEWQVKSDKNCSRWPEMHLPRMLDHVFLLSVPVLKAHSLSGVTLTMKNMMGCPPPSHYQKGGHWGKSSFHDRIQDAVFDLNRYRTPDFTLLDASVGMAQAHLWGPECNPPVNRLAAAWDPVAVDSYGCQLLGKNYEKIGHIAQAHNILGKATPLNIIEI